MQYCIIYKSFAGVWLFSLLMIMSLTAVSDGYNNQYSLQLTGGQSNPWALPQAAENHPGYQQPQRYQYQPNQGGPHQNRAFQADRFVTPEFLESLKQQQTQMQLMPEGGRTPQIAPEQLKLKRPRSGLLPGTGSFTYPSYGTGNIDPLYDMPAVTPWSPWGIGQDAW